MKRTLILAFGLVVMFASLAAAQTTPAPTPGSGTTVGPNFVDANGDGICDRFQSGQGPAGRGLGPRDGSGKRLGPRDGTGSGNGPGPAAGKGTCDGTGPKGMGARRGAGPR